MQSASRDSTKRLFCGTKSPGMAIAEGRFITNDDDIEPGAGEGALVLLFERGQRPDAHAVRAAVEGADRLSITHEFAGRSGDTSGFELLRDGMTYDLTGLAPGLAETVPLQRHRYGLEDSFDQSDFEALALRPGPHLVAGAHSLPVVRTMAGVAAALLPGLPTLRAVAWPPAGSAVGPGFFASTVATWLSGGAFPALGFAALAEEADGSLRSEGLAWFNGQELRLAADLAKDRTAAARLGVRLINQLVLQGRVTEPEVIVAPDGGRLALEPTRDGAIVRVRRG